MPQFRKLPVVVDAFQLPGSGDDNMKPFDDWAASVEFTEFHSEQDGGLTVWTLEGDMRADPGDWIIKGVAGEFYPCKPDIFARTYEPAGCAETAECAEFYRMMRAAASVGNRVDYLQHLEAAMEELGLSEIERPTEEQVDGLFRLTAAKLKNQVEAEAKAA